jgi:RNA polymerase sigma-70 factor (ECF subfamily)
VDHPSAIPANWHSWLDANVPRYLLFARSQTRSEADAHDLLQEVLVEIWRREPCRLPDQALVFQTIRRRAIDLGRRTDSRERREQAVPPWWELPARGNSLDDAELEQAVRALPAHLSEVVLLKVWSELTFRQIAGVLGLPPGTVASRYKSAIEHLRGILKEVRL